MFSSKKLQSDALQGKQGGAAGAVEQRGARGEGASFQAGFFH